jgi:hypothetical protein
MKCSFCNQPALWSFFHKITHNRYRACAAHKHICDAWQAKAPGEWDCEPLR